MDQIRIRGARTHNLKNVDIDLPRDRLIVITGLSGSGKSSLAFDTLYAEGQRRYVESLSAYARQFLSLMEKPDVDLIEGLSPAISIEQKSTSHNPRSTVGTVTEIYDYLRLLYARVGEPRCPTHGVTLAAQTVSQMVDHTLTLPEGTKLMLLAPLIEARKGEHLHVLDNLRAQGYVRARIDGIVTSLDEAPALKKNLKHTIEAIVDRVVVRPGQEQRLAESFENAINLSDGIVRVATLPDDDRPAEELVFSARYACTRCGYSLSELEPRLFSFNNPAGACPSCDGLGVHQFFDPARVVSDPTLPLPAGAIRGWDRRNPFYFQMLESLAKHYGFDLDRPFNKLPKKTREVILYGSGEELIKFTYVGERSSVYRRTHPFEGVIPNMERRYRESESNTIREELAKYLSTRPCEACGGSRLKTEARHVYVAGRALHEITNLPVSDALAFFRQLKLEGSRAEIAQKIVKEIGSRLGFLVNVGLDYLSLARSAETLSGGEAQRIRLASQIGAGLVGVMYILDEPSIGLHQRDNARLLETLSRLRDLGNTVIVVEHDEEAIRAADFVLDIGPGAGVHGGRVVASGRPEEIARHPHSLTGQYLRGQLRIEVPERRVPNDPERQLVVRAARGNNLRNVDASMPVGLLTCVTGVSGSGKSTLINDTLYAAAAKHLYGSALEPAPHDGIEGLDQFDKVVDIDQSPIGRTPRSNPATYTGLFTPIRELFAATPEARSRGYGPGRFSFNVRGGRCEACQGDGLIKVEMHFLPDIYVPCDTCKGKRYNRETLEIRYKDRTIDEVLKMTVEDALAFFEAIPVIRRKLETLMDVGLSYITLGQSATTLSGGEAQRVKLARELSKRDTGRTLYILDEPTTGLHFHDIQQLLAVLARLRDHGNTVVVIEHNLDVIKTADWIIDLGPEGGDGGGRIIAAGTPEEVAADPKSHTGRFLKPLLERAATPRRKVG
ncbi:excinuclease ABC subunit A [Sulfurifustis variabilis]|uniref:UvrABC system protein A n=1 Tax=Sulfurifustis variabilis TaxID=1675686 RepID=A0A1B4V8L8_9GAMM|nr:excinuclease ABC subunit UvrA [Sulfurifustis variabilis]BAU49879.1 excinuclease ABC subunit A [Sulfurifustis variabilis]